MANCLWVFLLVMLLVYWLGADLGVLLRTHAASRAELSFAARAVALRMAIAVSEIEGKPGAPQFNCAHLASQAVLRAILGYLALGIGIAFRGITKPL
jgi:hypothetical protein